jgi:hypothetical protein
MMNERIKELAEQARYDARHEKHYLERVHNREFTVDEYQEIYDKKFAEFIIQECCDQLRYGDTLEIKKHFGVE